MTETITKQQAKELIDDAPFGLVFVAELEPIPQIGEVDMDDVRVRFHVRAYHFEDFNE